MRFCALANHLRLPWAIVALDGDVSCRERLDPGLAVSFPAVSARKRDTLGNVRRFARVLRDLRPSVLVTHNFGSIEWAMANTLVRVPHVHIEDGFGPEERDRQLPRRVMLRRLLLRRERVVLPSRTLLRIATDIWKLPHARYIPNGIDLGRFAGPLEASPGRVVGTVAGLRPEKNVARLLHAMALLRAPAQLVVVGDGPERARLEALSGTLGVAVRFAGHLAAPADAYRQFDIFALSSDTEQMPLSLLEAMAAGLPVAATDVGDVAEMLDAANRRFVVPPDAAALAAALDRLLDDADLRRTLGAANRARAAEHYGQDAMFAAYGALLAPPRMPSGPR